MKVILSRKGFDSGYGGYPSIILPTGEMVTLPIPSSDDKVRYSELRSSRNQKIFDIMKKLNKNIRANKLIELQDDTTCHLDPDLVYNSINRSEGWRGSFGQISAAQKVLENNNVKEGDLFIFFGWFNDAILTETGYKFKKGNDRHTIFGYLEIDKIIYPNKDEVPEWLKSHPHAYGYDRLNNNSNCIYIAKEICSFNKNIKGYGTFIYNKELDLTKEGMTRTKWDLPDIFRNLSITYHNSDSWKDGYFKSACRGQEFVVEENEEVTKWAKNLINNYSSNRIEKELINS